MIPKTFAIIHIKKNLPKVKQKLWWTETYKLAVIMGERKLLDIVFFQENV